MRSRHRDRFLGMDTHSVILTAFFGPIVVVGCMLLWAWAKPTYGDVFPLVGCVWDQTRPTDKDRCACGAQIGPVGGLVRGGSHETPQAP